MYQDQAKPSTMVELEAKFQAAATRIRQNSSIKATNEDKLELYSLFKQASEGDCKTPKPGWFDFTGKAKWEAWNSIVGMTKSTAMNKYISVVDRLDPGWETDTLDSHSQSQDKKGGSSSVGHAVSTLAGREAQEKLPDNKKNLFDWCKEGNLERLGSLLNPTNINEFDSEGMGLLHWACDRGNLEVVKLLVERGADINIQDREKQTPLHYAASCDHEPVVSYLLSCGAKSDIPDCDGYLPNEVTTNPAIRGLFHYDKHKV